MGRRSGLQAPPARYVRTVLRAITLIERLIERSCLPKSRIMTINLSLTAGHAPPSDCAQAVIRAEPGSGGHAPGTESSAIKPGTFASALPGIFHLALTDGTSPERARVPTDASGSRHRNARRQSPLCRAGGLARLPGEDARFLPLPQQPGKAPRSGSGAAISPPAGTLRARRGHRNREVIAPSADGPEGRKREKMPPVAMVFGGYSRALKSFFSECKGNVKTKKGGKILWSKNRKLRRFL